MYNHPTMTTINSMGLYIHVPFCLTKCHYCAFFSVVKTDELVARYVSKICLDIKRKLTPFKNKINTIFIGGGNPTSLGVCHFEKIVNEILNSVNRQNIEEFTIESNPETINKEIINLFKQIPNIRLSLGVQRLKNNELTLLGRNGSTEQITQTFDLLSSEFTNISADFIIGAPSCADITKDLSSFINRYQLKHISTYFLTIEDGTKLKHKIDNNELQNTDDIGPEEMFSIIDMMHKNKFEHYEISNYSQPTFECKHNLHYWQQKDYLGLGPSAVGTIDCVRTTQPASITKWLNETNTEVEILSKFDKRNEYVMLHLRTLKIGLSILELEKLYGKQDKLFYRALTDNKNKGLISISDNRVKLTAKGISFANSVMASLFT